MDIVLSIVGAILFLAFLYMLSGIIFSIKVNFASSRTHQMIYRNEWKENIPHGEINPFHKDIYLTSNLGYEMSARFFPAGDKNSHKYLLMLHGYTNNSVTCGKYACVMTRRGINCIAPDARKCGNTGGRGITFGYYERSDAEQWIEEIYKMDEKAEIGIFGISLGAATAILTASLRNDIKYVISYCSFASFKDIIHDVGSTMFPRLIKIMYPAIIIGGFITTGARLDLIDIAAAVKKITCPVLILHSKGDAFTPFSHALKLKEANPGAELKFFEGSPHAKSFSKHKEQYTKYLNDFLNKNGI
ncbi:MAG: alpha/beta hydrolase [Christensenellales bacterium]|jgi:pimeloyl-ACP methyl ester carboxylesterase